MIHEGLGDVDGGHARRLEGPVAQDELMERGRFIRQVIGLLEPGLQVVRIEAGPQRHVPQARRSEAEAVDIRLQEHGDIAQAGMDHADAVRKG